MFVRYIFDEGLSRAVPSRIRSTRSVQHSNLGIVRIKWW